MTLQTGLSLLLGITPAMQAANQDAWISILVAGISALIMALIFAVLGALFPQQTLVDLSQTIMGKWLGKIIIIPFFVKWFVLIASNLRQSSDFLHLILFDRTPLWLLLFLTACLTVYVNYRFGVESIGRCSEIIGPLLFTVILIIFLIGLSGMEPERILPIWKDSGIVQILKGSTTPMSLFGESVIVLMLFPFTPHPKAVRWSLMHATMLSTGLLFLSVIAIILTFDSLAASMRYPFFTLTGYISLMEFIQNIDAIVVIIWFFSIFVKISLYVFVLSYGITQWLGLKNWKKIMWGVILLGFTLSLLYRNINDSTVAFLSSYKIWIDLPLTDIAFPLIMLIVYGCRKKLRKVSSS